MYGSDIRAIHFRTFFRFKTGINVKLGELLYIAFDIQKRKVIK